MTVVAHFQSGIPCPTVASETPSGLLTPRTVVARWTLTSKVVQHIRNYNDDQRIDIISQNIHYHLSLYLQNDKILFFARKLCTNA